ncbi:unnamed protein product [Linum trigynum]|uniref:Uncharacterized protein n=1 Tax=Linum trigynum TaxID=586398 RepID=A0AAV2D2V0_9ROSI
MSSKLRYPCSYGGSSGELRNYDYNYYDSAKEVFDRAVLRNYRDKLIDLRRCSCDLILPSRASLSSQSLYFALLPVVVTALAPLSPTSSFLSTVQVTPYLLRDNHMPSKPLLKPLLLCKNLAKQPTTLSL